MKPHWVIGVLAGLVILGPARPAAAQAPANPTAKARAQIREKWEARAAELAKGADADHDGAVSETEFGPLWDAAEKEKHEIVRAVCSELGIAEADPPKDTGSGGGRKKGGKKGGGKAGGKKGGGKSDPSKKTAEAFRKADADADGKVTPAEAARELVQKIKADNDPTVK